MIIDSIVSSPIEFPKIIPNDWDQWWHLWSREAAPAVKMKKNHNGAGANWVGMNVYVREGVDTVETSGYNIKTVNCPELFPVLFDNIDKFPIILSIMQIVSSRCTIAPHTDNTKPKISIRSMLSDTNLTPTFYYKINSDKKYQTLPADTNTWMYHDNKYKHGSDYHRGYNKHLIIFHGSARRDMLEKNLVDNEGKYTNFIIRDSN
jgi:hypothetical protein